MIFENYQNKFNSLKNMFIELYFTDNDSIMLSNFILENNININDIDKNKILDNKKDIIRLIYIVDGLYDCLYLKNKDLNLIMIYLYNNNHINFLLPTILNKYNDNILNEIENLYLQYKNMLIIRLK